MKFKGLYQKIRCLKCRYEGLLFEWRRQMNFTHCEIQFFCSLCRHRLGKIDFALWNDFHRAAQSEKAKPEIISSQTKTTHPEKRSDRPDRNKNKPFKKNEARRAAQRNLNSNSSSSSNA